MDALQIISNATQIITAMFGAVSALDQASVNLREAPRKIETLEEFVGSLESLMHQTKVRNKHKLHNPQIERQLQSLSDLIKLLHANLSRSRKVLTKNKAKGIAKLVWSSMVGDPLSKYIQLIRDDLNWWIELQNITDTVSKVITSTAESQPSLLRVRSEKGYPVSRKCHFIRELLVREDTHQVILIVGLSGIGKSCLACQIASDPPGKFCDGAIEINFGRWCSRSACNGNVPEYHNRLSKRIKHFLVQIGCGKWGCEIGGDLKDVCLLLQAAMVGKSMLVLLDDVWEQDIVNRFVRLYDNECRYLVTTRDEAVYEITEAEKVEICKDDIKEISKEILLYHTLLSEEELPVSTI
jgi:NB-ARC domain